MARPSSRRRRTSREPEPDPREERRGRRSPPPKTGPAPVTLILGGMVVVLVGIVAVVMATSDGDSKKKDDVEKVVLGAVKEESSKGPAGPAPPQPLTPDEQAEVNRLFAEAQPHIDRFREHAKAGWDHKGNGDNNAANDEWVEAKHEFITAIEIVSEVMEDEDRFSMARQEKYMRRYLEKMTSWQKEWSGIPKVNVVK